jgi:hypothetical protein
MLFQEKYKTVLFNQDKDQRIEATPLIMISKLLSLNSQV